MKKVLFFVLALLMVLPMAACSKGGFERGKVDGQVYENKSVGITFTAPEGWNFMSDEEISVEWNLGNKSFEDQLAGGEAFDAVAKSNAPGAANMAMFKYLDMKAKYGKKLSVEEFVEALRADFAQKNPKFQVRVGDITSTEFGGDEFDRVVISTTEEKIDIRYVIYMKELEEDRMFTATVKLMDETPFDDVEDMFK